jgi:haloacetate dehalogenase
MFHYFRTQQLNTGEAVINVTYGGQGPPLLLLHGYPQTHVMWHLVAPRLAERFTVVAPDLRGYGDSSKPVGDADHLAYSKRVMSVDQVRVMQMLGFDEFAVAGHDRGARVAYRMARDFSERVTRLALLDVVPTGYIWDTMDRGSAMAAYHWLFLAQPFDLPERLIGSDPEYWLRWHLKRWSRGRDDFFADEAIGEYIRCFSDPTAIHGSCEDYRAGATIDLKHELADKQGRTRILCPLLVLSASPVGSRPGVDPLDIWREEADDVRGRTLDSGHFLAEEVPDEVTAEFLDFFSEVG